MNNEKLRQYAAQVATSAIAHQLTEAGARNLAAFAMNAKVALKFYKAYQEEIENMTFDVAGMAAQVPDLSKGKRITLELMILAQFRALEKATNRYETFLAEMVEHLEKFSIQEMGVLTTEAEKAA